MTKKELIKALEEYDDDDIVVLGKFNYEPNGQGWSNIGYVVGSGGIISITMDYDRAFSSET
jgi:hypothetical protein